MAHLMLGPKHWEFSETSTRKLHIFSQFGVTNKCPTAEKSQRDPGFTEEKTSKNLLLK